MIRSATTIVVAVLALAGGAAAQQASRAGGAGAGGVDRLTPIPGVREYSGRLVLRPVQREALIAAGQTGAQADEAGRAALDVLAGYDVVGHEPRVGYYVISVPAGSTERETTAALLATGRFEYVEPDWILYPVDCPNDPLVPTQWHHNADRLNSCAAWDITTGDPSISVGICDTGIRLTHEDLLLRRLDGYNATTGLLESQGGQVNDLNGHGTSTSGCAAANGNNGKGVSGVGQMLSFRMLRVSESSGGSSSLTTLTHAALKAIELGDRVASVSYSGVDNATVVATAATIRTMGGMLVWAAGNDARNLTFNDRDADALIVVGATNSSDAKASFSAFGPFVDLVAPGESVFTTTNSSNTGYGSVSGTSFSCPLTAGMIALIWSADPSLTPAEVETFLKSGCDDLGAAGVDNTFGYGRIDALGSVSQVNVPIKFTFPSGIPAEVDPLGGTTFRVTVVPGDTSPQPGTGVLHVNDGSGWVQVPMDEVSANVYDAVFPAVECLGDAQFYVSAETVGMAVVTSPSSAPVATYAATATLGVGTPSVAAWDFEAATAEGWTVGATGDTATTGIWNRMDPQATAAQPGDDHTIAPGVLCWVTDGVAGASLGERDVDGGRTTLVSPVFSLTTSPDALVGYWRWYSNSTGGAPNADVFRVEISNNGGTTWVAAETVGPAGAEVSGGWFYHEFRFADILPATATARLRFIAEDAGTGSLVEAAVDDVRVFTYDCPDGCYADCDQSTGAGTLDFFDFVCFQDRFAAGDPYSCDCDESTGTGVCDFFDFVCFQDAFGAGCP